MAAPLEMTPESAAPEAILEGVGGEAIEGRSLGQIAWMRLKRDKVAMGSGIFIIFLILVAIFGPYLVQNPNIYHPNLINPTFSRPNGPLGGISLAHPFGVEPVTGRDMLARIVDGAPYSLGIGFVATVLAVVIGVVMGIIAGFYGGWVDWGSDEADDKAYARLLAPDGEFYVVGDQVSTLPGWQEGAMMSAEHVLSQIAGPRAKLLGAAAAHAPVHAPNSRRLVQGRG